MITYIPQVSYLRSIARRRVFGKHFYQIFGISVIIREIDTHTVLEKIGFQAYLELAGQLRFQVAVPQSVGHAIGVHSVQRESQVVHVWITGIGRRSGHKTVVHVVEVGIITRHTVSHTHLCKIHDAGIHTFLLQEVSKQKAQCGSRIEIGIILLWKCG